jgi:hypothetical protein
MGWKRNLGIAAGVLFGLAVIGSIAGDPDRKTSSGAAGEDDTAAGVAPVLEVTAQELFDAFEGNEVAAKVRYGGQRLAVTGVIAGISLDFRDRPVVSLETSNEFLTVDASFGKDYTQKTARLRKGQKITVTCEELTEVMGNPLLSDCTLP